MPTTCWDCGRVIGDDEPVRSEVIRTGGILVGRAERVSLCPGCSRRARTLRGWAARLLGRVSRQSDG